MRQKSARGAGEQRHDAKAGTAGRHRVQEIVTRDWIAALARHAAYRVSEIPEVSERALLDRIKKRVVRQRRCHRSACQSTRASHSASELPPIWMMNAPGSNTCSGIERRSAWKNRSMSAVIWKLT